MHKPKVLVIDDEEMIRDMISDMLTPMGYDVIHACDGEDGVRKVQECSPDVVLLDVTMPKLDGFGVLQFIKQTEDTKMIPVVMITALNELKVRVKAIDIGVDDFLSKPMDIMELRARVKSLIKVKAYNDHMKNYQKELEIEVAKRTEEVQIAYKEAKNAAYETVHILSRAAEYRDEDTGAHLLRVSNYTSAVAVKMGLNEEEVEEILYGAPMHDVGKIGIPDNILMKPGKLDPDEFEKMKEHVKMGELILQGSSAFIKKGAEIALSHHEKWNGSGYPNGFKEEEIALSGRIIAVVDVFDALTTRRPYKEPFPLEKALEIIKTGRGEHFDPKVVDAFFEIIDEIKSIKEKYKD